MCRRCRSSLWAQGPEPVLVLVLCYKPHPAGAVHDDEASAQLGHRLRYIVHHTVLATQQQTSHGGWKVRRVERDRSLVNALRQAQFGHDGMVI
jgi:hypothetical protein